MDQLSESDKQRLLEAMGKEPPPTLGVVGLSGAGKSSAINSLFKTDLPISHTSACTKEFWRIPLEVKASKGGFAGRVLRLDIVDAPGLGEDVDLDPGYLAMYGENLPRCDVILWVLNARNRALALDQVYLEALQEFVPKTVFGLSQVDLVHPVNWQTGSLIPSREQQSTLTQIVNDREKRLSQSLGRQISIIPFSSERGYNMAALFVAMLKAAPATRKWLFDPLLNYNLEDWVAQSPLRSKQRRESRSDPPRANHREKQSPRGGVMRTVLEAFGITTPIEVQQEAAGILGRTPVESDGLDEREIEALHAEVQRAKHSRNESMKGDYKP